jgi:peptidoglycan/xylan/chitin deacetylase (PgdA/CDA1 family)
MKKKKILLVILIIFLFFTLYLRIVKPNLPKIGSLFSFNHKNEVPVVTPSPTPSPTPKPLTFAEMNALYGPCVYLPTLMYHHVQDMNVAKGKNQQNLTVSTETFRQQMMYLRDRGYQTVGLNQLVSFFDEGMGIPKKSILLTFDDAYEDTFLNVFPILKEVGFKGIVFTPTGLVNNDDYLNWDQISEMASYGIVFANHTWSHKNVKTDFDTLEMEITTADTQLSERGYNLPKSFAYPYGLESSQAVELLNGLGYKLAFSTRSGSTLCKKQRLGLPRVRIGNVSLSAYGF